VHIGIIGAGYVGLVTGACFAEFGIYVTCIDKDEKKVRSLKKGEVLLQSRGWKVWSRRISRTAVSGFRQGYRMLSIPRW